MEILNGVLRKLAWSVNRMCDSSSGFCIFSLTRIENLWQFIPELKIWHGYNKKSTKILQTILWQIFKWRMIFLVLISGVLTVRSIPSMKIREGSIIWQNTNWLFLVVNTFCLLLLLLYILPSAKHKIHIHNFWIRIINYWLVLK